MFILPKGPVQLVLVDICKMLGVEVTAVTFVFTTEIFSSHLKMINSVSFNPSCAIPRPLLWLLL